VPCIRATSSSEYTKLNDAQLAVLTDQIHDVLGPMHARKMPHAASEAVLKERFGLVRVSVGGRKN